MNLDPTVRRKLLIGMAIFIGIGIIISIIAVVSNQNKALPSEVTKLPSTNSVNEQTTDPAIDGTKTVYNIEALRGQNISQIQTDHITNSLKFFIVGIKSEVISYLKINEGSASTTTNTTTGVSKITFTVTTDNKSTYDVAAQYVRTTDMFVSVYQPGTTTVVYIDPYDSE